MNARYDFAGQVALVTGAARGMGLATARAFARSGASIVLADIDGDLAAREAKCDFCAFEPVSANIWERSSESPRPRDLHFFSSRDDFFAWLATPDVVRQQLSRSTRLRV
jgi:NAD(P)-dependent dehydrogenase (short-subunit alcohol dehydrogenase family)